MLTLRAAPQIASDAVKYTSFNWNAILRRLQQMTITGTTCPDRLDWSAAPDSPALTRADQPVHNKSAGSYLAVRGTLAPQVDVSALAAASFFPPWQDEPVAVAAAHAPFRRYEMSCALLTSEKVCALL